MKGYTIENSIDLLEKDVKALKEGGGGGGASTWNQLTEKPFNTLGDELYSLSGALTVRELSSDKVKLPDSEAYTWEDVSEAIDGLATEQTAVDEELSHINEDIVDLTSELNIMSARVDNKMGFIDTTNLIGSLKVKDGTYTPTVNCYAIMKVQSESTSSSAVVYLNSIPIMASNITSASIYNTIPVHAGDTISTRNTGVYDIGFYGLK